MSIVRAILIFLACLSGLGASLGETQTQDSKGFDGPAELPRIYMKSSQADTPAPGPTREVKATDDLQSALDGAKCGETLRLQAGATFSGKFRFPQKQCDDAHWIIVRTSAPDDALPREGSRITPCFAGVASLPGRPDYSCGSPKNAMAKIVFDATGGSGPILFASGANHYRFIGLEITRAKPQTNLRDLVSTDDPAHAADHLIFDRVWLHGTAADETKSGLHLSGITYAAVVDSYLSDFHCFAGCTDAQAVNGGTGDLPGGPYKIVNNFLEASGENIMFGGSVGSTIPADIEIRHNHFFKPLTWLKGQPGFVTSWMGGPFIVKNLFELKNAQRVLLEGNLLENCWGGFTQQGYAIVLTPANQGGKCPLCRVTDVTIRYNKIRHVGGSIAIANVTGRKDASYASSGGQRYSFHDLVFDDLDGKNLKGFSSLLGFFSMIPPVSDVSIDHVTAFPNGTLMSILNLTEKVKGFAITNSIITTGRRQIVGGGGGTDNCVQGRDSPAEALNKCFENPKVTHNLIVGGWGEWPPGNILVKDIQDAYFQHSGGTGGDYRLCAVKGQNGCAQASPAIKAGTDGKDLGADVESLEKVLAGVE